MVRVTRVVVVGAMQSRIFMLHSRRLPRPHILSAYQSRKASGSPETPSRPNADGNDHVDVGHQIRITICNASSGCVPLQVS